MTAVNTANHHHLTEWPWVVSLIFAQPTSLNYRQASDHQGAPVLCCG